MDSFQVRPGSVQLSTTLGVGLHIVRPSTKSSWVLQGKSCLVEGCIGTLLLLHVESVLVHCVQWYSIPSLHLASIWFWKMALCIHMDTLGEPSHKNEEDMELVRCVSNAWKKKSYQLGVDFFNLGAHLESESTLVQTNFGETNWFVVANMSRSHMTLALRHAMMFWHY